MLIILRLMALVATIVAAGTLLPIAILWVGHFMVQWLWLLKPLMPPLN